MSVVSKIITWLLALIIGAVFGAAGTVGVSSAPPVGFIVSLIGCLAILIALRSFGEDRWAAVAGGVGMYGMVFLLSQRGPGGSVLLPAANPYSTWWLIGVGAIILVVLAWPNLRAHTPVSGPQAPSVRAGR
ncbi:hypothetical protein [Microbacterium gorillae]|uniref:hypothetical protein n=1 Tax=Microbacterium gorillae TaxID=1231063 RepID=UPI00058BFF8F|nr:hypothetical protein [Microbacterium gorillae]